MAGAQIQNVSFASPTALIAPDLVVQQQQLARNQALAQQLRQSALGDIPGNGGRVSWSQGASKLADAILSKRLLDKSDKQQAALSTQYAGALRSMFGMGSPPAAADPAATFNANGGTPSSNPLASGLRAAIAGGGPGDRGTFGSGGVDDDGSLSPPPPGPAPAQAGAPAAAPVASTPPPQPPQATAPQRPGPWSLTGDPASDVAMYSLSPDEYAKALIGSRTPTDAVKNLTAAGLRPGSPEFNAALGAINRKAGFIDPTNLREGGTAMMNDGSGRMIYAPHVPEGYQPVRDAQGNLQGIEPVAGGPAAVQGNAAAKAIGGAAGDVMQTFDPNTGQPVFTPKTAVLGGGYAAGAPLGAAAAADTAGKNSADAFQRDSDVASDARTRLYAVRQMQAIASKPGVPFGPGVGAAEALAGHLNGIGKALGYAPSFNAQNITDINEFNKWTAQLTARSAQDMSMNGSDARLNLTMQSTPNGHMTQQALQAMLPKVSGLIYADMGHAQAAQQWSAAHGQADHQAFVTAWNRAYDPAIFMGLAQGKQAFAQQVRALPQAQAAAMLQKYRVLSAMGAIPNE